ncbi:MAG: sorbosone dehydrogenase family protein [Methylophilus sp.]|nr:sorbosone dehydrogenase family protein [Methylophilus sp.]
MHISHYLALSLTTLVLSACGDSATLSVAEGTGPTPVLPSPNKTLLPTVHIATAVGWYREAKPIVADGLQVNAYAENLKHPRWLYELPNGDVLVAETNAPPKPDSEKGIRQWIVGKVMAQAGAAVPSANRISLLQDNDKDGVAEVHKVFLEGLHSPFGMVLVGNHFYVANADSVVRYDYADGQTEITSAATKVLDLPGGPINHHWTKNIIANGDGSKLYITVGSNSNVAERGMENEVGRAAIWEFDIATGQHRIFASGLRNPNGLTWEPTTNALWTVVNERDEIGSDLVPDYLTSVKDGGFYGWPYSYYGQHIDERVTPQNAELVASALVPDYALGPHTASLGLTWSEGNTLSDNFKNGMFIGQHGSWNRKPFSGYKVIFVPFNYGKPAGKPIDVLTGFVNDKNEAQGRPVGVVVGKDGSLLVADDVGNKIWRVTNQNVATKPN